MLGKVNYNKFRSRKLSFLYSSFCSGKMRNNEKVFLKKHCQWELPTRVIKILMGKQMGCYSHLLLLNPFTFKKNLQIKECFDIRDHDVCLIRIIWIKDLIISFSLICTKFHFTGTCRGLVLLIFFSVFKMLEICYLLHN